MSYDASIPKEPICRDDRDETKPCTYAGRCHTSRQMNQSGLIKPKDSAVMVQVGKPAWGPLCWAFSSFRFTGVPAAATAPAAREPGEEPEQDKDPF